MCNFYSKFILWMKELSLRIDEGILSDFVRLFIELLVDFRFIGF